MELFGDSFRQTRIMGGWLLRMTDRANAMAAVEALPAPLRASVEVRQSIWGVEVRTEHNATVLWLKDHYKPSPLASVA